MSLSRRDFLKYGGATASGVALGTGVDLAPVEAAAVSLRIKEAKAFAGVCPYCAVGCGQLIYAKDDKIVDIEGNPDTPHTLGRLCPKGAATIQLSNNPLRPTKALYRAPGSDQWEEKPIAWMYDEPLVTGSRTGSPSVLETALASPVWSPSPPPSGQPALPRSPERWFVLPGVAVAGDDRSHCRPRFNPA